MKHVILYTDGACSGNPGPGGWGVVLKYRQTRLELSGYEEHTTNNRMELMAAIKGLEALKQPCQVALYSDSAYLVNAYEKGWIFNWQNNGWLKADKKPVENRDLWERLVELAHIHKVSWHKVTGHSNNEENNRCDQIATGEIKQKKSALSLE